MAKTVQLLAVVGTVKDETKTRMAQLAHVVSQSGLFTGLDKTYRLRFPEENGVQYPPESKKVRVTVPEVTSMARTVLTRHWDLALTLDTANAAAKANITVDGELLVADVPVGHLLWLARELETLQSLVAALPVLDPGKSWDTRDLPAGLSKTPAVETPLRVKVPGKFVLAEATQYHPAQVQRLDTDEVTGFWSQVDYSGAVSQARKEQLLARLVKLSEAVRMAREDANTAVAVDRAEGSALFDYLLA